MNERLQMQGKLTVLSQQSRTLSMKAEAACKTIRAELNPALMDIDEMDIPMAANEMDDLVLIRMELLNVNSKIDRLNKELGLG